MGTARKKSKTPLADPAPAVDEHSSRVGRISVLLSELGELMRQEGLGKEALHHLRQLQMRVRFALEDVDVVSDEERLPTEAPKKWKDREQSSESPITFITREYAVWLGKGLTRAHLRQLDMSLYEALKHWMKRNKLPEDFDLPTKQEMIDRKLAQLGRITIAHSPEQREKLRLYKASRRRAKSQL